jgi:tetratricopeptide (TPR) repeat protein
MSNLAVPTRHYLSSVMLILASLIFSCVVVFVVAVGRDLWIEIHTPIGLSLQNAPFSPNQREQITEAKIQSYDKRAEDLEKLISFLIGLSVFYTLALGVASYLGLQQTLQQAQGTADKMEALRSEAEQKVAKSIASAAEKATEIVHEIRDEFPLFGYMDVSIRRITSDVLRLLPFIGWSDQLYGKLTEQQRQEILFYEKTVAGLEFFDLRSIRKDVSKIYDGLGNFYALKFQHEAPGNMREDLERCRFYLDRAKSVDEENIAAWNDIAFVAIVLESPTNWQKARESSERSLRVDSSQQRARYNLSIVEHNSGNYSTSEGLLTDALKLERWQEDRYPRRIHNLYYNRACARSRRAEETTLDESSRGELLEAAFKDLKEALSQPSFWDKEDRKTLAEDLKSGGDLHVLFGKYETQMKGLLTQL